MSTDQKTNSPTNSPVACPVCRATDATIFLEIASVPVLCNVLWPNREEAIQAPRGPVHLAFCRHCNHIWNAVFDPERIVYSQQYENSLHFSPRFQSYAESLAHKLIAKYDIRNKHVIDIGCGQGDFLRMLCQQGNNQGVGFDPAYIRDPEREANEPYITFVQDLYTETYASYSADFVCSRHTLEHVPVPSDMVQNIKRAIGDREHTIVFFEVPHVLFILRDWSIWDIIYEHCSYFSARSIGYLFAENGFNILDISEEFGGQFLTITSHIADSSSHTPGQQWDELQQMAGDVEAFATHYHQKIAFWNESIDQIANSGRKAVIWGAGSKGIMFLNTLEHPEHIEYVVDINPRKHNMYVTGTGHKIVPPDFLQEYRPDVVIVMNPMYKDENRVTLEKMGINAEMVGT